MSESAVQIVDGTKPFGNPAAQVERKPSKSLEPDDAIEDYEFEQLGDGDEFVPGKNPGDKQEGIDDQDDETGDDDDEETNPKDKKSDSEDEDSEDEEVDQDYLESMGQAQQKMLDIRDELDRLKDQYNKPQPKKPTDDYDDSAMRIYEAKLVAWENQREQAQDQIELLNQKARNFAREQERAFREKYPSDEVGKFEAFIKVKPTWYYAYISGEETLEDLFRYFKAKQRPVKIEKKPERVTRLKPIKPTRKSGKATKATTDTGIPAKFKYANMPMFKGYAKELKAKRHDIAGNRMTDERIDQLCRQELKVMKGEPIL